MRPLVGTALVAGLMLAARAGQAQTALGSKDPGNYPATDTSRVAVGTEAPDFTLESLGGGQVTLSSFRGAKHVILVYYRGHW